MNFARTARLQDDTFDADHGTGNGRKDTRVLSWLFKESWLVKGPWLAWDFSMEMQGVRVADARIPRGADQWRLAAGRKISSRDARLFLVQTIRTCLNFPARA